MRPISALLAVAILLTSEIAFVVVPALAFVARSPTPQPAAGWRFACDLSSLPDNGEPIRVPVKVLDHDAWTKLPDRITARIDLRRVPASRAVVAVGAEHHPLFRIPVVYEAKARLFRSTCWNVEFDLDGRPLTKAGSTAGDRIPQIPTRVAGDQVFVWIESP